MPYRIDFFNELGKLCDLTVVFGIKNKGFNETWMTAKSTHFNSMFLKSNKIELSVSKFQVLKMFNKKKYDLFVVDGYSDFAGMYIIEALRIKRIPFILNSDGSFIKEGNFFSSIIKRHFITSASYWNCSGEYTKKTLIHYGAAADKISTYPLSSIFENDLLSNPISIKEKQVLKKELGISQTKIAIAVGRFIYSKGFDNLIKAWEKCNFSNEYGLYIIGEGILKEEYEKVISDLNIKNIKVISFKQSDELIKYYKASDVFVMPTRSDVWGLVINEAMACGLPIISTNKCIAAIELVNDFENGFIVPVDDVEMLTKNLQLLLTDSFMINNMAKKSIEKIKEYTIESMAKYHVELFKTLSN